MDVCVDVCEQKNVYIEIDLGSNIVVHELGGWWGGQGVDVEHEG